MKIALAGNPNSGKSTIFNYLTGTHQHVGNWPGVTVEKKEGYFMVDKKKIKVIDLPGVYSLSFRSIEEKITTKEILYGKYDLILNIVDSTNLWRGLYLTLDLLELNLPVILVLTKVDMLKKKNISLDLNRLKKRLNIPIIGLNARNKKEVLFLKKFILKVYKKRIKTKSVKFSRDLEKVLEKIEKIVKKYKEFEKHERWFSIKILEKEEYVWNKLDKKDRNKVKEIVTEYEKKNGFSTDIQIASEKYKIVDTLVSRSIFESDKALNRIDELLIHPIYGSAIFITVFYLVFKIVFGLGAPLQEFIQNLFEYISSVIFHIFGNSILSRILSEGIIPGVGAVLSFFPQIFLLFFIMSLLEDIGYMSRVSILFEHFMKKVGLTGKSIVPMILGFGCNVPAIMATRNIDSEKERLITILVNPLIPCTARLAIVSFFVSIFFGGNSIIVVSIYLFSILLTFSLAFIFSKLLYIKSTSSEFIQEVPEFIPPSWSIILSQSWNRSKEFLVKAGTIIFLGSVVLWFIANYPEKIGSGKSYAETLGKYLEIYTSTMGLDWRAGISLLFGVLAKENVIATLGILYNKEGMSLNNAILSNMSPLQGLVLTIVTILYVPCIPTISAIRNEAGTKWAVFTVVYMLLLSSLIGITIWHIGSFLF